MLHHLRAAQSVATQTEALVDTHRWPTVRWVGLMGAYTTRHVHPPAQAVHLSKAHQWNMTASTAMQCDQSQPQS